MTKSKWTATDLSMIKVCTLGSGVVMLLLILFALLSTVFITNEYLEFSTSKYLAGLSQFFSYFVGCTVAGKLVKEKKAATCTIVTAVTLFIQLAVTIFFFDGLRGNIIICMLPIIAAYGCAVLLSVRAKKQSASKRKRVRSR